MFRARSSLWGFTGLAFAIAALIVALIVALPRVAKASDPFLEIPPAKVVDQSPAFRYANMDGEAALQELDRRKILYQRVGPYGQVKTPIRLTGRLHGVHIHSALPEHQRPTTPFEICDARFALALDDFSALLSRHNIVEVIHYTMFRPSVGRAHAHTKAISFHRVDGEFGWAKRRKSPKRKKSGKGKRSTRKRSAKIMTQSRHPLGLAIDIGAFVKKDGSILSVASHFRGRLGVRTCGPGAAPPKDPRARELWAIVCEAYNARIFTYVLTPNFDRSHQDHFHMDIKPDVRWFLYH